jgi:hypothetical protein
MSNDTPTHWQFTGRVRHTDSRQTAKGKTVNTIVLESQRGDYTDVCVCDTWRALPERLAIGATVHAEGRMSGREYNGRWYAGLVATAVEIAEGAEGEDAGQLDDPNRCHPATGSDGLPF